MSFAAINNFFHLLATVTWIGGMIYSNLILFPSLAVSSPPERGKIMNAITGRFIVVAWVSVVILIITGLIKTPSELLFNTSSDFGLWLTIKHILILLMIVIGM
ncbi:MAG: hypothetical protein Kow0098_18020 [Ignavibacteriaceae bacterium]